MAKYDVNKLSMMAGHDLPIKKGAIPEGHIYGHVFQFSVNVPTGHTADIPLKTGAILSTDPLYDKYHDDSDSPDVLFQWDAIEVVPALSSWATMNVSEKAKLVRGLQIVFDKNGEEFVYNIGQNVRDMFDQRSLATAADGARVDGLGPYVFPEGPIRWSGRKDEVALRFKEAAPTVSGGTGLILCVHGWCAPITEVDGFSTEITDLTSALEQRRARYLANMTVAAARASYG